MKQSDVSEQDKFDELVLDIPHPKSKGKNFVFVEGQSDIKLFRKLFDLEKCKVEHIPGGKDKLEQCVANLLNLSNLIVGIRDADFILFFQLKSKLVVFFWAPSSSSFFFFSNKIKIGFLFSWHPPLPLFLFFQLNQILVFIFLVPPSSSFFFFSN